MTENNNPNVENEIIETADVVDNSVDNQVPTDIEVKPTSGAAAVAVKKNKSGVLTFLKDFFGIGLNKPQNVSPLIKQEGFFKRNRFVFLAFGVPLLLMSYAFIVAEFYPFGENQIMVIDMWHQFFQFFKVLHEKLQTGGSLLYTWQGGLGTNFIALISYYAASPLNLLTIFVPTKYLTEALAAVVVLKISFSGAFMCIYLRSLFKRNDFGTATFSILYALSAFAMGYYWCVMWLDVMAILPLCLLGLNRLVDEGKFKLYVLSLALMLISNYYIGIMMCMFIVIYYPVIYFSRLKPRGTKYFVVTSVKAALFSALAACIAAVILIPTYFSMQNTYYIKPSFPATDTFYNPILDVVSNLLPNVALTVRGGLPNIYCGLLSFMMAVLFLLCKKIPVRQKVLNSLILAFLILSFNWNKLDYIWHCLHFPNELPYRYSFVFSFILITMAYQAYLHLDDLTPGQIGGVAAGGFIYIIIAQKIYDQTFDYKVIYISLLLLAAYSIVLAIHKSGRYKETLVGVLMFVVVFGEMTNYTISSVSAVGSSNRTSYFADYDDVTALINTVEKEDDGFYRMEVSNAWTTNDPALYGYNGVSQFSSEINAKVTTLMKAIGLAADPGSNRFGYSMTTPVINSMLNVKYIIGRSRTVDDFALGSPLYTSNGSTIYRNKYALSIGYMAYSDIKDWSTEYTNPFDVQNQYVWYATGVSTPVFEELDEPVVTGTNVTTGPYSMGTMSVSNTDSSSTSSVQLVYTATKTQPIYAFIEASDAATISATTSSGNTVSFENNRGSVNSLGTVKKGDKITVDISYEQGKAGNISCYVNGLDEDVWNSAYSKLSDEMLEVTSHSDTHISGTITVKDSGTFVTSIPYEKGWSIKVDGKKVDAFGVKDALLACDLDEGTHTIDINYHPYGFYLALPMSIISLIALFAIDYLLRKLKAKNPESILVMTPNDKGLLEEYPAIDNASVPVSDDISSSVEETVETNDDLDISDKTEADLPVDSEEHNDMSSQSVEDAIKKAFENNNDLSDESITDESDDNDTII